MQNHEDLTLVGCPECGAPAEVVDRAALESTDGPGDLVLVELVTVRCALRHSFRMLAERISSWCRPAAAGGEEWDRWTPVSTSS